MLFYNLCGSILYKIGFLWAIWGILAEKDKLGRQLQTKVGIPNGHVEQERRKSDEPILL